MNNFVVNRIGRVYVLKKFSYTPRAAIFCIDLIFSVLAVLFAGILFENFQMSTINWTRLGEIVLIITPIRALSFWLGKTYSGIIRYTGTEDVFRIFGVLILGELTILLSNAFFFLAGSSLFIPLSLLLTECMILTFMMTIFRLLTKMVFVQYLGERQSKQNVIICGNDEYGLMAKHALDNDLEASYHVIAFLDVNDRKMGKILEGVKIYKSTALSYLLRNHTIDKVVIAKKISQEKKNYLVNICLKYNTTVLEVPQFNNWINGDLNVKRIKNIKIEDLLNRDIIELDEMGLRKQLLNKAVLVTGAAGSIGSEIVRQLIKFKPSKIILFDEAESPLYDIQLEIYEQYYFDDFAIELGDVRDERRVEEVFVKYRPDVVYHAAAYKHVPMMELLPIEGIKTNVLGTKNVADLAVKYECDRFVMISTDKAVNPTNIMGCTKRIAEIYIQSLNRTSKTAFITTRFGNVLGSNGSVIPRFAKQIESGGPITVTHPEITRFFMTIPEACLLVLQAGVLGEGGEIFVFDMGESVKIVDLARRMIKLYGYEVGKDIHIVFTGLRPGEKLYEEVLNIQETTLPTPHSRIKRAKVREYDIGKVKLEIDGLIRAIDKGDVFGVVKKMKLMVPEYKSQNSVYEEIDFQLEARRISKTVKRLVEA